MNILFKMQQIRGGKRLSLVGETVIQ